MKALFLDIDGVLQPCGRQERFSHQDEIPFICKQLNQTVLSSDWREGGIKRMKGFLAIYNLDSYLDDATYCILDEQRYNPEYYQVTEAWRNILDMLYKRFRELYPADPNKWFDGVDYRAVEIREYLDRHPEITSFVALDDRN